MIHQEPLSGKSFCVRCCKEIPLETFLELDQCCEECNELPNTHEWKRCTKGCRHKEHEGYICNEPMLRNVPGAEPCKCRGEELLVHQGS